MFGISTFSEVPFSTLRQTGTAFTADLTEDIAVLDTFATTVQISTSLQEALIVQDANAVDEWWYDGYAKDSFFKFLREATQEDYDNSWWVRYLCRVMWLYRNNAYGFMFYWFGTPEETLEYQNEYGIEDKGFWWFYQEFASSFKFEMQIPIPFTNRYYSINIGWKSHRSAPLPRKMFANRFIGIREYE